MGKLLRKRTLILLSAAVALVITSSSFAQITIVNQYNTTVNPIVPSVHMVNGYSNSSSINESTNSAGSVSYVNVTHTFTLGGGSSFNLTGFLTLPSLSPTVFNYLTSVTEFSGQNRVTSVTLYGTGGNGSYNNEFSYNSTTGYSNGTNSIKILQNQSSSLGLLMKLGKNQIGGPYTWNLNFEINGYVTDNENSPAVYTQFYVHMKVTTILIA